MSGRPRLLLVNASGADEFLGGAEAYVARLADGFSSRGFGVTVLAAFPSETRGRRVIQLRRRRSGRRLRRVKTHAGDFIAMPTHQLAEAVSEANPDLVHTNNLPGFSTAIWEVARRQGAPVVHTLHDYHLLCPRVTLVRPDGAECRPHPLLCGLRTRRLMRWAAPVVHVIGVSQYILARHAGLFQGSRLTVIHHPAAQSLGHTMAPPGGSLGHLGYLGALEHTKGVDRLLAAAPQLDRLGVTLWFAGNGRLRDRVQTAAAELPNVRYNGPVAGGEKDDFLERCDAGILPSVWQEPGAPPITALEWLTAGRPLLTSPVGGIAEALPGLAGAIRIEPTTDGIVEAVAQLRAPAAWREAVGRVRRPSAVPDVSSWLDEHERVYRAALETGRR
jgi:glycosyltransferase involved in cell wall biosynthesis